MPRLYIHATISHLYLQEKYWKNWTAIRDSNTSGKLETGGIFFKNEKRYLQFIVNVIHCGETQSFSFKTGKEEGHSFPVIEFTGAVLEGFPANPSPSGSPRITGSHCSSEWARERAQWLQRRRKGHNGITGGLTVRREKVKKKPPPQTLKINC